MSERLGTSFGDRIHAALTDVWMWITDLSALDWVLIAVVVFLIAWGWVRARAFVRLGSIQIDELTCDGDDLEPIAARATLQQALGERGWLPPSGVPSGSPSVAALADALSQAPVSQASWIGSLLKAIPWPATSTGFRIGGTLIKQKDEVMFAYQLTCTGPRASVKLGTPSGIDQASAMEAAAKEIYRKITDVAPEIYPPWVRWSSTDALTAYRKGLDVEYPTTGPALSDPWELYSTAYRRYVTASKLDPENLLVRLRMANCLERMGAARKAGSGRAPALGPGEPDEQIQALAMYLWVRQREPDVFEARFRASVLMSTLATDGPVALDRTKLLETVNGFVEASRHAADEADEHDRWPLAGRIGDGLRSFYKLMRTAGRAVGKGWRMLRGKGPVRDSAIDTNLTDLLQRTADSEADQALKRLAPLWSIIRANRFRHRFELTGRDRRQMSKALAISGMARKARRARFNMRDPDRRVSDLRQLGWRMWVFWRYMAGRSHVAGWQAHYNAACFYALLPQGEVRYVPFGSLRIRKRALVHLRKAVEQSNGELPCSYVRDEDSDLKVLREKSPDRMARAIAPICPDDLTVH